MQVVHHKPAARGVTQLMYVGDDQAVEGAIALDLPVKIGAIAFLAWLVFRRKG